MYKIDDLFNVLITPEAFKCRIITGYIGPAKVEELIKEMPNTKFEICVGMYIKIPEPLFNALNLIQENNNDRVSFFFSNDKVHIKTYLFIDKDENVFKVLNGSANLSANAFSSQKESLSSLSISKKTVKIILNIFNDLFNDSLKITDEKIIDRILEKNKQKNTTYVNEKKDIISWSILAEKNNNIDNIVGISTKKKSTCSSFWP